MEPATTTSRRLHYVLSTHWDREWHQTFQDFRRLLVRLLDRVLDDLETGKLKGPFTMDGQAILLEDYLEIRPERRERLKRAVKEGRLIVGPWYVMPDEWLVSGESLVRNIRLGRAIARDFGGIPSNAGFVCDLFGHVGQLPQILKQFGITGALIWRGLDPRRTAHVLWKGADGTELPCYRFGRSGYHGPAVNDQRFVSSAAQSDVALVHDGAQLAQFRIRTRLNVPEEYLFETRFRSEKTVPLVIDNLVTLRAGSDRMEISTSINNNARDHRLRVLFPSGAQAQTCLADGTFDVVERQIGLPKDAHLRRELPVETTPQQSWTAVTDKKRGLAIISTGLMESAVCDQPERPIALTLFRSTRRTVMKDGEPEGQLLGPLSFHYWIMPLAKGVDRRKLSDQGLLLSAGLRTAQVGIHDLPRDRSATTLPPLASYLKLEGPAVLSSVRRLDDCLEVRLFNPELTEAQAQLDLSGWPNGTKRPRSVRRVDLESNPLGEATNVDSKAIHSLYLKPKEIVTLQFGFGEVS